MKTFLAKFKPIFYLIRLYQSKKFSKSGLISVLLFIVSIIISILLGIGFSWSFRLTQEHISYLLVMVLVFQLVTGASSLIDFLINESEYESLLVLPIPSGNIAIVKVIGILASIYKYSFLFYITLLVGLSIKLNLFYGVVITLFLFLYSILSIVIFTSILLLLPRYLNIFRNKKVLSTIASSLPILLYIAFTFSRTSIVAPILKVLAHLPVIYLFSTTILLGNIFIIILSLFISITIIYLFYKNIDKFLSYILLNHHSKTKRKQTNFSYFKYEFLLLTSNPSYISELLLPSLFMNILILIQLITAKITLPSFGISVAFGILASIMVMNGGYLNTTALSREAHQMDSILSMPINGKKLYKSKLIPNYIFSLTTSFPLILYLLYTNLNLNFIGFFVAFLLNSFIVSGFLVIRGFENHCFTFSTIKQLTSKTYGIMNFMYILTAGLVSVMLFNIPYAEYFVFIYFIFSVLFFYTEYQKIDKVYQDVYLG